MFWKNEYDYTIIDDTMSEEDLKEFLNENGIGLQIVDNSTRWCAFAQYYAHQHDFDVIKATSFSYIVSLFMTGMGISASTEMYFKEEQIQFDVMDKMYDIKSENIPEEAQAKKMFWCIFRMYEKEISRYEYATERLSLRLTHSEMQKFQSVPGKNNTEKFKTLLNMI